MKQFIKDLLAFIAMLFLMVIALHLAGCSSTPKHYSYHGHPINYEEHPEWLNTDTNTNDNWNCGL